MNNMVDTNSSMRPYNALLVANELRKPLDNIQLSSEMLRTLVPGGDEEIYLGVILRSAARIDNLINAFLMFAYPGEVPSAPNSLHQLLDEVLDIANERIIRKQVLVSKEYTAPENKIILNKPAMKIALVNIMMNIIDSMAAGDGQLRLKTKLINDKYVLRIEHNGRNISNHAQENIFQPHFFNNNSSAPLGLATAFYLLRSNYITIDLEMDDHRGASYNLTFKKILI